MWSQISVIFLSLVLSVYGGDSVPNATELMDYLPSVLVPSVNDTNRKVIYQIKMTSLGDLSALDNQSIYNLADHPFLLPKTQNIDPCSVYKLYTTTYDRGKLTPSTLFIRSQNEVPFSTITTIIPFATRVNVMWSTDKQDCADHFELEVNGKKLGRKLSKTVFDFEIKNIDLEPCSLVTISLLTYYDNGENYTRTEANTTTTIGEANVNFIVQKLDKGGLEFSWESLNVDLSCFDFYTVKLNSSFYPYTLSQDISVPSDANSVIFDTLDPCENYTAILYADSDKVAELNQIYTDFIKPTELKFVELEQYKLKWGKPLENWQCVANYVIEFENGVKLESDTNSVDLYSFPRCQIYNVKLQYLDKEDNSGDTLLYDFYLQNYELNPVTNLKAKVDGKRVTLSWVVDNEVIQCVQSYSIKWDNYEWFSKSTEFIVPFEDYCRSITFEVTAIYSDGQSEGALVDAQTSMEEISSEPTFVTSILNSTILTLFWEKPFTNPYCAIKYKLTRGLDVYETEENTINLPVLSNHGSVIKLKSLNQNKEGTSTEYIITDLSYQGVHSIHHEVLEDPGYIKLKWSPPVHPSIEIIGYEIKINSEEINIGTKETEIILNVEFCILQKVTVYVRTIHGADFGTDYSFLPKGVPGPVDNLQVVYENPDYIVRWSKPSINSNCIKNYKVVFWNDQTILTDNNNYRLKNWKSGANYNISVIGLNSNNEEGTPADIYFTTHFPPVKNLKYESKVGGQYLVSWDLTIDNKLIIETFTLRWPENEIILDKDTTSYMILIERFCKDFKFSITVNYDSGSSDAIEMTASNHQDQPGPVSEADISYENEKAILRWKIPKVNQYCVKYYSLTINDEIVIGNTLENNYTFEKWEGCDTWNVIIRSIGSHLENGAVYQKTIQTKSIKPSKVQNIEITPGTRSFDVSWQPPENGSLCVTGYRLSAWKENTTETVDGNVTATTLSFHYQDPMIKPCQIWEVQIISFEGNADEGDVTGETVKLEADFAPVPDPLHLVEKHNRSLTVETSFMDDSECFLKLAKLECSSKVSEEIHVNYTKIKHFPYLDGNSLLFELTELEPWTNYSCKTQVLNEKGWSDMTQEAIFETEEDYPEEPSNLALKHNNVTGFLIQWEPPIKPNGLIRNYVIRVEKIGPNYLMPQYCPDIDDPWIEQFNTTDKFMNFENTDPLTNYEVQVMATNGAGNSQLTDKLRITTYPADPDPPANFTVDIINEVGDTPDYNASASFHWRLPCAANGLITMFNGSIIETGSDGVKEKNITIRRDHENQVEFDFALDSLKPAHNYQIQLQSYNMKLSTFMEVSFESPAGIPKSPENEIWADVEYETHPWKSVSIRLNRSIFTSNVGEIKSFALLISERNCGYADPERKFGIIDSENSFPVVPTWKKAYNENCTPQYQALQVELEPLDNHSRYKKSEEIIEKPIGSENCESSSEDEICNGQLKAQTEYAIMIRLFTKDGYNDSPIYTFTTYSTFNIYLISVGILGSMVLAFLIGYLIYRNKKRKTRVAEKNNSDVDDPIKKDILIKNFLAHFENLAKSNFKDLESEFRLLVLSTNYRRVTFSVAKNKMMNKDPYRFSKVLVTDENGDTGLNSPCFINGYRRVRGFIASQCPKEETTAEFWQMVFQKNVPAIVMLAGDNYYQYFPKHDKVQYDDLTIACEKECEFPFFIKRVFRLKKDSKTHIVYHYQFLGLWIDQSCPEYPQEIVDFTKFIQTDFSVMGSPVLVHCSTAGLGRIGTYIALDIETRRIKAEKKINIFETVKQLRKQRAKLVNSLSHYLMLYHCVALVLKKGPKSKNKNNGKVKMESILESYHVSAGNVGLMGRASSMHRHVPLRVIDVPDIGPISPNFTFSPTSVNSPNSLNSPISIDNPSRFNEDVV